MYLCIYVCICIHIHIYLLNATNILQKENCNLRHLYVFATLYIVCCALLHVRHIRLYTHHTLLHVIGQRALELVALLRKEKRNSRHLYIFTTVYCLHVVAWCDLCCCLHKWRVCVARYCMVCLVHVTPCWCLHKCLVWLFAPMTCVTCTHDLHTSHLVHTSHHKWQSHLWRDVCTKTCAQWQVICGVTCAKWLAHTSFVQTSRHILIHLCHCVSFACYCMVCLVLLHGGKHVSKYVSLFAQMTCLVVCTNDECASHCAHVTPHMTNDVCTHVCILLHCVSCIQVWLVYVARDCMVRMCRLCKQTMHPCVYTSHKSHHALTCSDLYTNICTNDTL